VPSLSTMYVYKPMVSHTLMQAIARVNRVYKDKEGGLVVDYVGIAAALKQAMNDYTGRDKHNYGDTDIAKTALPKFLEKLEVCRQLFHGFDYAAFMTTDSDLVRARLMRDGANFLWAADKEAQREAFIKEALLLRQALSLCRSLVNAKQRLEAAYFEAVRTLITRIAGEGRPLSLKEINARINELLKASIHSEGVINLFSDVKMGFSLFDAKFLEEIARMKQRNLTLEILKKLLAEQVTLYRRTNLVKSEAFSERLARAMKAYLNGLISNEEVIAELIKMAKDMANARADGEAMGLNDEELAFYDALTRPEAVKDFYDNEELVAITRELTDQLRKSRTIDWQKKESARAGMRRMVKKLLKQHKYPPEGLEDAIATVISQCELWADV
jgi:type I restriction enzyme R subunit